MNQLAAMRAFRCIVESGGFSAAAERLDTTHSTMSRQLQQLESELGVQLINRNTRRFSLTGVRKFSPVYGLNPFPATFTSKF